MKLILSSLLFVIAVQVSFSQDYIYVGKNDVKEKPAYENKSYVAVDYVKLTPGFIFTATPGNSFYVKTYSPVNNPLNPELNFVRTETMLSGVTDANVISTLPRESKSTTYSYMDAIGRPLQNVDVQSSPLKNDVIQPFEYDGFGRQPKDFMSYTISNPKGGYRKDAVSSEQAGFYTGAGKVAGDNRPFNLKVFDDTPMNQVRQAYGAGEDWQTNGKYSNSLGKVDLSGSILKWTYNGETSPPSVGTYPARALTLSEITDEQGVITQEYKDFRGLSILSIRDAGGSSLKTYNVYDRAGRLCMVIPPEAVARIGGTGDEYLSGSITNAQRTEFLNRWAFQYVYDGQGRLIKKRAPGMGYTTTETYWTLMVYDQWDRLVLTREPGWTNNQWTFTKYDALNRPVLSGIYSTATSHDQLQIDVMASYGHHETVLPNNVTGYTLTSSYPYSTSESDLRSVTYYDNYNFIVSGWDAEGNDFSFSSPAKLDPIKGQTTGSKVRVLNDTRWLNTVIYYDTKYRTLYTAGENYKDGIDKVTNTYDFAGRVVATTQVHTSSTENVTVVKQFTYDHAGRLLTVKQTTGSGSPVMIASNKYNEAGQLIEKNLHSTDNGSSFLQSLDYKYNIRGWMTNINNSTLTNDGYNDDTNDVFGMDMLFNQSETINGAATAKRYNGNISAIRWKTNNQVDAPVERVFGFDYDNLNRLTSTRYAKKANGVWNSDADMYKESMTYDRNGNIKTLNRWMNYGGAATQVDALTYRYGSNSTSDNNGNRLYNVHDGSVYYMAADKNPANGYAEAWHDASLEEYGYDKSGRMTSDQNRSITAISYNYLNMPEVIELSGNRRIEYTYDAAGNKLRSIVKENGSVIQQTDYVGSFHYVNNVLAFIHTDEGRAVKNASNGFDYEYYLNDHQGNTRAVVGALRETKEYKATMESVLDDKERNTYGFKNINETRVQLFNHTAKDATLTTTDRSAETNGALVNKAVGPAKMISVSSGDRLQIEVYARYANSIGGNTTLISNLASAVPMAFGIPSGETAYSALSNNVPGNAALIPAVSGVAKAYVCYILFDNNYVFRQFGFRRISVTAGTQHERLFIDAPLNYSGYAYVYVANESNVSSTTSVYFDDLLIIHDKNNAALQVTQSSDYLPFGLSFNQYYQSRTGSAANSSYSQNKYQFQGQEKQTGFDLGWYHFKYRMHDPAIGRFGMVDPLADKYNYNSTYAFSENRLIDGVELEGLEVIPSADKYEYYDDDSWYNLAGKFSYNTGASMLNGATSFWNYMGSLDRLNSKNWSYSGFNYNAFDKVGSDAKDIGFGLYDFTNRPGNEVYGDLQLIFSNPHTYEDLTAAFAPFALNKLGKLGSLSKVSSLAEIAPSVAAVQEVETMSNLWRVGAYEALRGVEAGLDAHHVGQKAVMKRFALNYNLNTAPTILVPEVGHTIRGLNGIVSRSTSGFTNARQLIARDIFELRRVYGVDGIPNSALQQLINMNKTMYPEAFIK